MKIWLDNTGLQSAGKFLIGNAEGSPAPVYHLATLIAFSDELNLTGFEELEVSEMTAEIITLIDPEDRLFGLKHINNTEYQSACKNAANFCSKNFEKVFIPITDESVHEYPAALSDQSIKKQILMGFNIIHSDDVNELEDLQAKALESKAAGAVAYMLAHDGFLRQKAKHALEKTDGSWSTYRQIENLLRYHLNIELAKLSNGSTYAPAIGRSKIIRQAQLTEFAGIRKLPVAGQISELMDEFSRSSSAGAPSVHRYIANRAGSNPERIIKIAFEMREQTELLREKMRLKLSGLSDHESYNAALDEEINEIRKEVEMSLGIRDAPSLADAFDISFVVALPSIAPSVSYNKIMDWWRFKKTSAKNSLLTEISKGNRL